MVKNTRVIFVDDEPGILRLERAFLKQAGFSEDNLAEALSAEECLAMMEKRRPDIVVLDIMMPGRDGFWACAAIRSRPEYKDVKIAFYTAMHEDDVRYKMGLLGADAYIQKGVDWQEFGAKIVSLAKQTK